MKKTLKAKAITTKGSSICYPIDQSKEFHFVDYIIPKETAEVNIETNQILNILENSESRVEPRCEYFKTCGGCSYQHIEINKQRELKIDLIKHTLSNHYKIEIKELIDKSKDLPDYNYRNKAKFHFQNNKLGFFKKNTKEHIPIKQCEILDERINNLIPNFNLKKHKETFNVVEVEIKNGTASYLLKYNNKTLNNQLNSLGHFSQNNIKANSALIEVLKSEINSKELFEFYAGSGNLTFNLKKDNPEIKITAIERDKVLINKAKNTIENKKYKNLKFTHASTEEWIKKNSFNSDILLDPPRTGAKKLINAISKETNPNIYYVSCDIVTFGRDAKILIDKGYSLSKLYFFDMFPQTKHIEVFGIFN